MNKYRLTVTIETEIEAFALEDALTAVEDYFGAGPVTTELEILAMKVDERGPLSGNDAT